MTDNKKYNHKLVNYIQNTLGRTAKIQQFSNDDLFWTKAAGWKNKLSFNILSFQDLPQKGITTYTTLGLSEYVLQDVQNNNPPRRIELISVLRDDTDFQELTGDISDKVNFCENWLMYLSCYMVNKNSYLFPGDIWHSFFSNAYDQFSNMNHLFFVGSTFTGNQLKSTVIEGEEIEFLLCVPISDEELDYCEKNGSEALEKLLVKNRINVSDLFRQTVV